MMVLTLNNFRPLGEPSDQLEVLDVCALIPGCPNSLIGLNRSLVPHTFRWIWFTL